MGIKSEVSVANFITSSVLRCPLWISTYATETPSKMRNITEYEVNFTTSC